MTPSGHDPRGDSDGYRSSSSSDDDAVDGPAGATATTHEGWKMWQRVIDATTGGVSGVASAVKNRMNAEEGLCGPYRRNPISWVSQKLTRYVPSPQNQTKRTTPVVRLTSRVS